MMFHWSEPPAAPQALAEPAAADAWSGAGIAWYVAGVRCCAAHGAGGPQVKGRAASEALAEPGAELAERGSLA